MNNLIRFFVVMISCLVTFTADVFAAERWVCDYEFPATPVVHCVNQNGNFDHNFYYFSAGNNKCLVLVCHGFVDRDGNYGIVKNNQYRYDYPKAVAESINEWSRRGFLNKIGNFNYVFMTTCHAGYAQSSAQLPYYNIPLSRAINYKGQTAYTETPIANGQVMIRLYRVIPSDVYNFANADNDNLSRFLKSNNVKGFRAVGTVSSTKPKGAVMLSEDFTL